MALARPGWAWLAAPGLLLGLLAPVASRAQAPGGFLGDFRVTYYWVAVEDGRFASLPRDTVLRDPDGEEVARVSAAFRRELDREGTGQLGDGRVVNVATRRDGEWRYSVLAAGSWGRGVTGADLAPFLSVASDLACLPAGSRLFLPALAGLVLPDGSRHPGVVVVADAGAAIRGPRLDVFIARSEYLPLFERIVPSHSQTPVFLADGPPDCE